MSYKIGDRVIATMDIFEDATGDHPQMLYASKGEVLIVRSLEQIYPVNVSHEQRTDRSFGVGLNEIAAATTESKQ